MTVHKPQGKTIDKPLIIYIDCQYERRMLYTALTRARSLSQITIYNPKNQQEFVNHAPPPMKSYWETKGPLYGYIYKYNVTINYETYLYNGSTKAQSSIYYHPS
jgi:hypothetical protein